MAEPNERLICWILSRAKDLRLNTVKIFFFPALDQDVFVLSPPTPTSQFKKLPLDLVTWELFLIVSFLI